MWLAEWNLELARLRWKQTHNWFWRLFKNGLSGISDLAESSESGSGSVRPLTNCGIRKGFDNLTGKLSSADNFDRCEIVDCANHQLLHRWLVARYTSSWPATIIGRKMILIHHIILSLFYQHIMQVALFLIQNKTSRSRPCYVSSNCPEYWKALPKS